MTGTEAGPHAARADRGGWSERYRVLCERPRAELGADELVELADAAWWLSRVEESVEVRRGAHAAYAAAGAARQAGHQAWLLAVEHGFIGKAALARGWLTRARTHLAAVAECEEHGLLAFSDAERAVMAGDLDGALRLARETVAIGERCGSREVVGLGRVVEAAVLVGGGAADDGLDLLDGLMVDVVDGGLDELYAGWLYCLAVPVCFDVPDLARATAWNDAAMRWCETLPAGTPFHGLCRVHHVELLGLRGAWDVASREAVRACQELLEYHPNMAGEAFEVAGELHRRRGDLARAEAAFLRAHELGRDPQPGLALARVAEGRAEEAYAALRACLAGEPAGVMRRARLLAAAVRASLALGRVADAAAAAGELGELAGESRADLAVALAATARGEVALAAGRSSEALAALREARGRWLSLDLPFELAECRLRLADAHRSVGDHATAEREDRAGRAGLEKLGAAVDVAVLGGGSRDARAEPDARAGPGGLTERQVEVLRLLAEGRTNREIAEALVISPHTVGRHLENIYARIGVSSRAAATAFAHTTGIVPGA